MLEETVVLRNYAHIGDSVWELFVRTYTIYKTSNAKLLHKITTDRVKASFQAELLKYLEEFLTDEEQEIARRGRNLPVPIARRSNQSEYRQATAFETLVGWWFSHNKSRLEEIFEKIQEKL